MRRGAVQAVVFALAAALVSVALVQRLQDPFNAQALIEEAPASVAWRSLAGEVLPSLTKGTSFEARWQINRPPRDGWLTVVLIDLDRSATPRGAETYRRNCTYVGRDDLIICDVALVGRFLAERDLDKRTVHTGEDRPIGAPLTVEILPQELLRKTQEYMLQWVLGHEIGHILAGHGETHFTGEHFEDAVAAIELIQSQELAADGYLVTRFPDTEGEDMGFYLFLVGVMQSEVNRKACPDKRPIQHCEHLQQGVGIFLPDDYLRYSASGTHPEYVVRMVRLVDLTDQKHGMGIVGAMNQRLKARLLNPEATPEPRYLPTVGQVGDSRHRPGGYRRHARPRMWQTR